MKTNFSKVEEALLKGLEQMTTEQVLALTKNEGNAFAKELHLLLTHLQQDLKWLIKNDKQLINHLAADKPEIERFIVAKAEDLTADDWTRVRELLLICGKLKPMVENSIGSGTDEALVAKERRKHLTKRFNVNDKWLPLK